MRGGGARRGEVVPQTGGNDLMQAHGVLDVLEGMLAEIAQRCVLVVRDDAFGRIGEKNLLAPGGGADARSEMDISSDVALSRDGGLACVDAHADAQFGIVGPGMRGEGALGRERAGESVVGFRKGVEESISLGVDLDAVMTRKGNTQELAMPASTASYWDPRDASRRVEPSMSVKTSVTVPAGSSVIPHPRVTPSSNDTGSGVGGASRRFRACQLHYPITWLGQVAISLCTAVIATSESRFGDRPDQTSAKGRVAR
jgi:hypothetical protein